MYENILVCLDGSERAEALLPYVTEVALRFKSKLHMLQVISAPVFIAPDIPGSGGGYIEKPQMLETIQADQDSAYTYLNGIIGDLQDKGITCEAVVFSGMAGEAIISYAEENDIGLIAIASHGRTGLSRAIIGSVADHVLRHSKAPVFLLRTVKHKANQ